MVEVTGLAPLAARPGAQPTGLVQFAPLRSISCSVRKPLIRIMSLAPWLRNPFASKCSLLMSDALAHASSRRRKENRLLGHAIFPNMKNCSVRNARTARRAGAHNAFLTFKPVKYAQCKNSPPSNDDGLFLVEVTGLVRNGIAIVRRRRDCVSHDLLVPSSEQALLPRRARRFRRTFAAAPPLPKKMLRLFSGTP